MISKRVLLIFAVMGGGCFGASISLPAAVVTVPALSPAGFSFTYNGTLTGADTIGLTQIGGAGNNPCLQGGPASSQYCTNGGGVVTVPGTTGTGGTSTFSWTFNGTTGTWNFGSLILEISGEGAVQVFAADAADGLGSSAPPTGLTLPQTSLSALGFGSFTAVNPTITFVVADDLYTDNTGKFLLGPVVGNVPEPSSFALAALALAGLAVLRRRNLCSRG